MVHDLLLRGGTVVDGTGGPAFTADVAIDGGLVSEVGRLKGASALQEIDADGALVIPGFVDIHTHYDGQATWDTRLTPSSDHGVTTVVMGNCGVGFAPVRRGDEDQLIELMEGVEDLPGTVLHEGLSWDWETFPEYLDALERRPHDVDLAAQVCHGPLRLYVMGERGADRAPASESEIGEMGRIAAEGIRAGALGFTTSRTLNHRTSKGEPTPTLTAARGELVGIASAIGASGQGVLQVISDFPDFDDEMGTLEEMMRSSGRPLSISLAQARPGDAYQRTLDAISAARSSGLEMRAQVAARAIGLLIGLPGTANPLKGSSLYRGEIGGLPLAEQVAMLRQPEIRRRVMGEILSRPGGMRQPFERIYALGDPPDYEPDPATSIAARAKMEGRDPEDLFFDLMLAEEGQALLYLPFANYFDGNLEVAHQMLSHPAAVPGLGDGGAHVGVICDASFTTTLLAHWTRDRKRGPKFELPWIVNRQSRATAEAVGLLDRGIIAPGYKADINVIDFAALNLGRPRIVHDLPAGGRRLVQSACGYLHTFVSGTETQRNGAPTGALPGNLVRGPQPDPRGGSR